MRLSVAVVAIGLTPLLARAEDFSLDNGLVQGTWHTDSGGGLPGEVRDEKSGREVAWGSGQAWLELEGGERMSVGELRPAGPPQTGPLPVDGRSVRASEHAPGTSLWRTWTDAKGRFALTWRVELRDGSRYLRSRVEVKNTGAADLPLVRLGLIDLALADAAQVGTVNGSPVASNAVFVGVEHPLAENLAGHGHVSGSLPRFSPLRPGETMTATAAVGFTDSGQLRRDFLAYVERERARPYAPFLHYNTWYDIAYRRPFDEAQLLASIRGVGRELAEKRGVKIDAFVPDDGWDDPRTLWQFNSGFPRGLGAARELAARYGARLGIWLSPWGGYHASKEARLKYGREQGFEIRDGSFSLAGPRYYERFRELCDGVVRRDGVDYFKFDGIGAKENGRIDPASSRDFDAMLRLVAELRELEPQIFINLTTGTWPSPYWLRSVDSTWRGGEDHAFSGAGTARQRWINYRDAQTYQRVVRKAPLYPLNSIMIHGIIFAAQAEGLTSDPGGDFCAEVRSYFGSGTQLQELYISPQLLTAKNWDDLAAAARWSRANADTLRDTHWVGGDPGRGEIYGWASWSRSKGIITLRNPSDHPAAIDIDAASVFELPEDAPQRYSLQSPYPDAPSPVPALAAGHPVRVPLLAFGVLVLEAMPQGD